MKTVVAAILILVGLLIALVIVAESCAGPDEVAPPKYPANPGEVSPEVSPEASPGGAEPTTAIQYGGSSARQGASLPDTGGVRW